MKKNVEYIGVDEEFIPEDEKYVDESILGDKEESKRKIKKAVKGFGIGYAVFMGIFLVIFITMFIFVASSIFQTRKTINDQLGDLDGPFDQMDDFIDDFGGNFENQMNKQEVDSFNKRFELYSGTSSRAFVITLLDKVVTNNKKNNDKIITVIHNETITTDPNEIIRLKPLFKQGKDYEVILDYDANGLVNMVTIEDIY